MRKHYRFFALLAVLFAFTLTEAQTIHEYYHSVQQGVPTAYDEPGSIVYPTGYTAYATYTPVIFVHGITGKLSGSYEANIEAVKKHHLKAAFVQLDPTGTPEDNGKLLKRMIDRVTSHYGTPTVSIVAHSKGGMDTERALYGENPYVSGKPSFGYEKVDAVYTFGSPLRGSRVADVGSALSWTGIAWIAMWYLKGHALTSAAVQEFHNWAKQWRIQSNGTFRNYYHPSGASYTRLNLVEDNTTRWWAHQADDPCYENKWYFCTVGNGFHHSAGAYYDAYWEWDGLDSGWRNWHAENDGFVAVYRAKRTVITSASPALTPGAGDFNYLTTHDANHTSLWDPGQGHFDREAAPYLHRGLYAQARPAAPAVSAPKNEMSSRRGGANTPVYLSNGYITASRGGRSEIIIENDPSYYVFTVWSREPVRSAVWTNGHTKIRTQVEHSDYVEAMHAYENVFRLDGLSKGVWQVSVPQHDVVFMAYNRRPGKGVAVKWPVDVETGYTGGPVEVKILGDNVATGHVQVFVNWLDLDSATPGKLQARMLAPGEKGVYTWQPQNLIPGHKYAVTVLVRAANGPYLLQRSVMNTFYVPQPLPVKTVATTPQWHEEKSDLGFEPAVFPNPVRGAFTVQSDLDRFGIELIDLTGKVLHKLEGHAGQWHGRPEGLKPGVYLLRIETSQGIKTKRLLVD